jgi:hypothetical protein
VAWLGARGIYVVGGGISLMGVVIALPLLRTGRLQATSDAIREPSSTTQPAEVDATTLLVP